MKFLYATDLHGNKAKYRGAFHLARKHGVQAVINGGDMLPVADDVHGAQREYIEGFLDGYFGEFEAAGIYHLGYLGNDDLKVLDPFFQNVCSKYPHAIDLAQAKFELNSYEFIGMNWVADYPFQLKDRCRMDASEFTFPRQFGRGLLSTETDFKKIPDWPALAMALPTLEDELKNLPKPKNINRAVYVIHMPPARVGLDECMDGREVGSQALYRFILERQPLLTLHGHIHESPQQTDVWKAQIDKTVSVQPGQLKPNILTYVLIDLETMQIERFEEPV